MEVLRPHLKGLVPTEQARVALRQLLHPLDDLLVELTDAVEVHPLGGRAGGEPGSGGLSRDQPGLRKGGLAGPLDLAERLYRLRGERPDIDREVRLAVGQGSWVRGDEIWPREVRGAADGVQHVGGQREMEHLFD